MSVLRIVALAIVILWFIGFLGNVGGGIIHALIVLALILFVVDLLAGRRKV